eukprot:CAMPEP_0177356806 /NCGR_PEP_ID=MMETSP0368-20130122/34723_1 /TAXON_ID=447022 ORGANISM="Scrippsiella hangoei-like, Strain SHHI-4" /NCGR_SAMPLE_ID=MMETSP0368 /ASSEMBLY_ACC=CAM_ASM_000363 /LENGTH=52 /DNA_ID=CAMNT_0018819165 /DNA_START=44 /DNA_END=199 /DNA_ORIENTATION=-
MASAFQCSSHCSAMASALQLPVAIASALESCLQWVRVCLHRTFASWGSARGS